MPRPSFSWWIEAGGRREIKTNCFPNGPGCEALKVPLGGFVLRRIVSPDAETRRHQEQVRIIRDARLTGVWTLIELGLLSENGHPRNRSSRSERP